MGSHTKRFAVGGPIDPMTDYFIPFNERVPSEFLSEMKSLVFGGRYFSIRAPRQSGKTSFMLWFSKDVLNGMKLNYGAEDPLTICSVFVDFLALGGGNASVRSIVNMINDACMLRGIDTKNALSSIEVVNAVDYNIILKYLRTLSADLFAQKKLLVLIIDEADALKGDTGELFFDQLRMGYKDSEGSRNFPFSVCLVSMCSIEDFEFMKDRNLSASPFNVLTEMMMLPRFTLSQVISLFQQHTTETGQVFEDGVLPFIFEQTQGQPWLCNRIGKEICFKDATNVDRTKSIPLSSVYNAISIVSKKRENHMMYLDLQLNELRKRTILLLAYINEMKLKPLLSNNRDEMIKEEIEYYMDSGLIENSFEGIVFACPIYHNLCTFLLSDWYNVTFCYSSFPLLTSNSSIDKFYGADGKMLMPVIIQYFQDYWGGRQIRKNEIHRETFCSILMETAFYTISNGSMVTEQNQGLRPALVWTRKLNGGQFYKVLIENKLYHKSSHDDLLKACSTQISQYATQSHRQCDEYHMIFLDLDGSLEEETICLPFFNSTLPEELKEKLFQSVITCTYTRKTFELEIDIPIENEYNNNGNNNNNNTSPPLKRKKIIKNILFYIRIHYRYFLTGMLRVPSWLIRKDSASVLTIPFNNSYSP